MSLPFENHLFKVQSDEGLWWNVRVRDDPQCKGFAAKYHFDFNDRGDRSKMEPWYFGEMTREETEHLLGNNANSDGNKKQYHYLWSSNRFII